MSSNTTSNPVLANTTAATASSNIILNLQSGLRLLNFYATIFILVPGALLNLLTTGIFLRQKFWKKTTMGFYYSVSTFLSFLVCVMCIISNFPTYFNNDLQVKSDFLCKFIPYVRTIIIQGVGYYPILITLDQTLTSLNPRRFAWLQKIKYPVLLSAALLALVALSGFSMWTRFLKVTEIRSQNETVTLQVCFLSSAYQGVASFMIVFSKFVPCTVNTVMNVVLIRTLIRSKQKTQANFRLSKKEFCFIYSLVSRNILFILLHLMVVVVSLIQFVVIFEPVSTEYVLLLNLIFSYSAWPGFAFESSHFFIQYAFNRLFRGEVNEMFVHRIQSVGAEDSFSQNSSLATTNTVRTTKL